MLSRRPARPAPSAVPCAVQCPLVSRVCAAAGPKDPNCARCQGTACLRCNDGFALGATGKVGFVSSTSVDAPPIVALLHVAGDKGACCRSPPLPPEPPPTHPPTSHRLTAVCASGRDIGAVQDLLLQQRLQGLQSRWVGGWEWQLGSDRKGTLSCGRPARSSPAFLA